MLKNDGEDHLKTVISGATQQEVEEISNRLNSLNERQLNQTNEYIHQRRINIEGDAHDK